MSKAGLLVKTALAASAVTAGAGLSTLGSKQGSSSTGSGGSAQKAGSIDEWDVLLGLSKLDMLDKLKFSKKPKKINVVVFGEQACPNSNGSTGEKKRYVSNIGSALVETWDPNGSTDEKGGKCFRVFV